MNTSTSKIFFDGSSIALDQWQELEIHEDIFTQGMASLLRVSALKRPILPETQKYMDFMRLKRHEVEINGEL